MYHIKEDQRSIRSSEMLYEGLVKLMREKEFDAITVTELVEAAQVGRTTFYRNFDLIEDILWMKNDQVFKGLVRYNRQYRQSYTDESPPHILKPLLRYFYLNSEIIELLILANRMDIFQRSFRGLIEPFKSMVGSIYDIEEEYVEYLIEINAGAVTNILTYWIESGKKHPPDELADKLSPMIGREKFPWANIAESSRQTS
jgi:AcrR family transcriptional regulator